MNYFSVARPVRRHEAERDRGQEAGGGPTPNVGGRNRRFSSPEGAVRGREDELRPSHSHPRKARKEEVKNQRSIDAYI